MEPVRLQPMIVARKRSRFDPYDPPRPDIEQRIARLKSHYEKIMPPPNPSPGRAMKPVRSKTTGQLWANCMEAAAALGRKSQTIRNRCNAGGFVGGHEIEWAKPLSTEASN